MNGDTLIPLAGMLMVVIICIGVPFLVILGKKWQKSAEAHPVPTDLVNRLQRMEQSIDAVAIEVERISEGQRFVTKLLSERQKQVAAPPDA